MLTYNRGVAMLYLMDSTYNIEGVAAGMYIYVIQAGESRATKKMVLLK